METCRQCGKPLDDDGVFCKYCGALKTPGPVQTPVSGAQYCAKCGARLPGGGAFCLICGTKAGEFIPEEPASSTDADLPRPRVTKKKPFDFSPIAVTALPRKRPNIMVKLAGSISLLLFLSVAAMVLWRAWPYIVPAELPDAQNSLVYMVRENTLRLSLPGQEPFEIAGEYRFPRGSAEEDALRFSADGRYMAYLNAAGDPASSRKGDLYLIDLAHPGPGDTRPGESVLIAENVRDGFIFTERGTGLLFIGADDVLYMSDFSELWPIDMDVGQIAGAGDRQVLYGRRADLLPGYPAPLYNYCLQSWEKGADDRILVAENVSEILDSTTGLTVFLYACPKPATSRSGFTYDVGLYDVKLRQGRILVSSVSEVLESSAASATLIYANEHVFVPEYENLVSDPFAAADEQLSEPDPERYGLTENTRELNDEGRVNELDEAQYEALQEFNRDMREYNRKLERDELRERLRQAISELPGKGLRSYGIYQYSSGGVRTLEEEYFLTDADRTVSLSDRIQCDVNAGWILYVKNSLRDLAVVELEAVSDNFDLQAYIRSNVPQQLCFSGPGTAPAVFLPLDGNARFTAFSITRKLDGLYCIQSGRDSASSAGNLYYIPLTDAKMGEPVFVDTGVSFLSDASETFNGRVLYIKNLLENACDLYGTLSGTDQTPIARDIAFEPSFTLENDGKSLLYYRRFLPGASGTSHMSGELYLLGKQERMIMGDVSDCIYRNDNRMYLLKDWNDATKTGDAYVFDENGLALLDRNVSRMLAPSA